MARATRTVVWTPTAEWMANLAVDYQAEASPDDGERLLDEILAASDALATSADEGEPVEELAQDDVREVPVGDYRLHYRVREDRAEILALCRRH